ncbi:MaoC family dehydratase N-terminal domain-containing protein [Nocardia farcinica]|uniref:MaoC family dehydratase N-terminal domain-containing protein n=1 Tax=Nocardia farcinica TaxID=37329 RepID=UPI0037ABFE63
MPVSPDAIGTWLPPVEMLIERGRLRLFCTAIGEQDPIYTDLDAARRAGHPDLPVPPTFFCAIQHERPHPFDWYADLGGDFTKVLHGEQRFTYHAMAYAGDVLVMTSTVSDVYQRKGGALTFLVRDSLVSRDGDPVAALRDVIVERKETP